MLKNNNNKNSIYLFHLDLCIWLISTKPVGLASLNEQAVKNTEKTSQGTHELTLSQLKSSKAWARDSSKARMNTDSVFLRALLEMKGRWDKSGGLKSSKECSDQDRLSVHSI
jgi:hypothetical protein